MFEKLRNMAEAGNQRAAENLERERARGRELDAELEQATADVAAADERLANIDQEIATDKQVVLDRITHSEARIAAAEAAAAQIETEHQENMDRHREDLRLAELNLAAAKAERLEAEKGLTETVERIANDGSVD